MILVGTYWVAAELAAPAPAKIGAPPSFLPAQSVTFSNSRGGLLAGWHVPGRHECGSVVLMHAIRSNRVSMVRRARFLHEVGYSVLLFDFQAHGESDGGAITFGAEEQEDARAAVQFMAQQHSATSIGVIGFSLGGTAAVLNRSALGADALILEAVLSTLEQAVRNRIHQRVGFLTPLLSHPLLWLLEYHYGIDPQELRPIDAIQSIGIPVFVIGGTHDLHTLQSETEALFLNARSPKELWLVKGAYHEDFHEFAPTDYENRVLAFLNTYLGCASLVRGQSN